MNSKLKTPWKKVHQVENKDDFALDLTWEDGRLSVLDLKPIIFKNDILWRLRNPLYFRKVSIDVLGGICWPEGEDFSADYLEHHSVDV